MAGGVVVVTGGTAGAGRATVREFARCGYDVAVLARGAAGLRRAVADVETEGRRGDAGIGVIAALVGVGAAGRRR